MTIERKQLGEKTDIEVVDALLLVAGTDLVDVGCGAGKSSRDLAARNAKVLGVEPDPIQAEKNRQAAPTHNLTFIEARAEALPVASNSVDGVFFFRSLHHVPADQMDKALLEAARVLKPESGFLYIVEPAMTGTHFPVMKPFHDETKVRTEAQAALARTAAGLFAKQDYFEYMQYPRYDNFEALVTRVTGNSFNDIRRESVENDAVRVIFEAGRTPEGDYVFTQPMLLNLYRGAKKA